MTQSTDYFKKSDNRDKLLDIIISKIQSSIGKKEFLSEQIFEKYNSLIRKGREK